MKRILRKTFPLALSVIMAFTALMPVIGFASSNDYESHWAKVSIQTALDSGMVTGYPDGSFQPDTTITRAEFFQMVNSKFKFTKAADVIYTDVPQNSWHYQAVAKANTAGYISGYVDGSMHPDDRITRQEVAVIVNRLKSLLRTSNVLSFSDAALTAEWSKTAIISAFESKIMVGYPDGKFMPEAQMKRAEALVAINNCFNYDISKQTPDLGYYQAGSFGPSGDAVTIGGNIVIKSSGVTLKNVIVNGNATIGKEVGDGKATLDNVTVKGTIYISSGKDSTINLVNVIADNVIILKDSESVSLVVSGTSAIGTVSTVSDAILEESNLTGAGFKAIIVDKTALYTTAVTLKNVLCDSVNIQPTGTTLSLDSTTKIGSLKVDGNDTHISGTGTILSSTSPGLNVTFETTLIR